MVAVRNVLSSKKMLLKVTRAARSELPRTHIDVVGKLTITNLCEIVTV